MKKKIVSLALVASLLALVIVGGTLAYFTDTESAENTFVVGNVDITLTESDWTADAEKVQPGIAIPKTPIISNTGVNNAYVRMKLTISNWNELSSAATANGITDVTTIFTIKDGEGNVTPINSTEWVLVSDTPVVVDNTATFSYYYANVLTPGVETVKLFNQVTVPATFNNAQMQGLRPDFTITVSADAIQADTFDTVTEAFLAFDAQVGNKDGDAYLNPVPVTP